MAAFFGKKDTGPVKQVVVRGANLWEKKQVTISGERIAKVDRVASQARTSTDERLRELDQRLRVLRQASGLPEEEQLRHRSQGSMIAVPGRDQTAVVDPVFLELLTWRPALDSLVSMGFPRGSATFTDGYVISKPPRSPPLFWQ
mgnify:CR=1 FL=1